MISIPALSALVLAAGCQGSGQSAKAEDKKVTAAAGSESAPASSGAARSGGDGLRLDAGKVILSWSGGQVTYGDFQKKKESTFRKLRNKHLSELYTAEQEELEGFIIQTLVEAKAKAANQSPEDYVGTLAGSVTVTDADVVAFYDQNVKASGQPLEAVRDRIRPYLEQQKKAESVRAAFERLKVEAGVKIDLPPPQMAAAEFNLAGRPMKGNASAKVTVVEFSDFQCPYCSRATPGVTKLLEAYPNDVKVYFLHYPLKFHESAMPAAIASHCAHQQNKFWEFHDKLFANQGGLSKDLYQASAKELGLDESKFVACLDDPAVRDFIGKDMEQAELAGVEGTPSFYINGIPYAQGVPTVEALKPYVERAN